MGVETFPDRLEIAEAHDPPYNFSPDRVLRGEVYEKPWKPLALGTVALLGAIGLTAGYFPARTAARLDPVVAMKM